MYCCLFLSLIHSFTNKIYYVIDQVTNQLRTKPGRAMARAVSRRPLTAVAWVRDRFFPCGISGGQSGTGISFFSPSSSVCPVNIIPPRIHTQIPSGRWTIGPVVAAVQRHCLTPSTWSTTTTIKPDAANTKAFHRTRCRTVSTPPPRSTSASQRSYTLLYCSQQVCVVRVPCRLSRLTFSSVSPAEVCDSIWNSPRPTPVFFPIPAYCAS
jgi:hypothetical protein